MGHVAKAGSRRLQVERFVTLFPGRNSRAGVGTGSHCALSHCQGHRKKKRVLLVLSDKLCCQGPLSAGMRRTLLALPWLGVLSGERSMGVGGRTSESGEAGCVG